MPRRDDAEIEPRPEDEGEDTQDVVTNRDRKRIGREGRLNVGNRWRVYSVGRISYTPPEAVRTTVEKVRSGDLVVDPRYNRQVKYGWVEEIQESYNPDQLQVLNVSRRLFKNRVVDGKVVLGDDRLPLEDQVFDGDVAAADRVELVVLSGQHRLTSTLNEKGPDFLLWCQVFDGITEQVESELYALFDEKVRPHQPYDRHRAHVFGRNPEALGIDKIVQDIGLEVFTGNQPGAKDGVIYAVSTLYAIYRGRAMGPEFLHRLLTIHYLAWGDMSAAYGASMIGGTALLLRRFGGHSQWHDEWLVQTLSDPAHNPQTLLLRAKGATVGVSGTTLAQEIARMMHTWYVAGKKGYNRLLPWNATKEQIEEHSKMASRSRSGPNRRRRQNGPEPEGEADGDERA